MIMSNLYFVALDLWPETKEGDPLYVLGPAATFSGWIDIDNIQTWLATYEPEEIAVMFAEDKARLGAGDAYEGWYGIATVNEVRPESPAEMLARLGYASLPLVYLPA